MATIKLKNRRRRMFVCDLETQPKERKQTFRSTHDRNTGEEGVVFHEYQTYQQLTLLPNQVSQELEEEILSNASIKGAIRSGWLQVIR